MASCPLCEMGVPTRVHLGYRVDRSLVAPEDVQLLAAVRPGDRVTILTPQGQERSGRCVLKYPDRAVLNLGGAHGTPGVATARNIVRVKKAK